MINCSTQHLCWIADPLAGNVPFFATLESHVLSSTKGCNWVCLKTRCSAQDVAHGLFCGSVSRHVSSILKYVGSACHAPKKNNWRGHWHANAHGTTMKITSEMKYMWPCGHLGFPAPREPTRAALEGAVGRHLDF